MSQRPSSGVLKTVTAASGTGHNIGTATSLQRGQITAASGTGHNIGTATSLQRGQIGPLWREVAVPIL